MHTLTIKIPLYKITVHVKISNNIEKVINNFSKKKKLESISLKEGDEVYGYAVAIRDCCNYYIFYDINSLTSYYITHEVSHIIDYILEEKDLEKTGEAKAYITGHISENIFDFVLKKGLFVSKYLPKEIKEEIKLDKLDKTEEIKPININEDEKSNRLL